MRFWKEHCFGLTAETLVDKAKELDHIGGTFGGNRKPTPFMCLVLKMLQIQPEKAIVLEFIKNELFKYAMHGIKKRETMEWLGLLKPRESALKDEESEEEVLNENDQIRSRSRDRDEGRRRGPDRHLNDDRDRERNGIIRIICDDEDDGTDQPDPEIAEANRLRASLGLKPLKV
ncbi:hypothetical protein M0R45_025089 [Rubus argutus]|uniref:Pre-mRNA-splicing factor 38 n=1 Tax=Rubus argutus TaxID=59490 RepID=A0AAW1WWA5_RUBAR